MKNWKAWIISMAVICTVMLICGGAIAEQHGEFYPKLAIIIDCVELSDLRYMTCQDKDGNIWGFYDDDKEYQMNDIVNLLMWNLGEREEGDEIIEVYKEGHVTDAKQFFNTIEWR